MNPQFLEYHERAKEIGGRFNRLEGELLDILQTIDEHKIFRLLGYKSLFDYALREMKLSESIAYIFINVSRKAREVPQLKEKIKQGNLSVSKAKKITSVINQENSQEWLKKAETLSQRKLERAVAQVSPKAATPERATYVSEKRLKLQLGVDEEVLEQLKRIQDLLSQQKKKSITLEEALAEMARFYLEKKDPIQKAQEEQVSRLPNSRQRKAIPTQVKHQVFQRDQGQCTFHHADGRRCESRRFLDFHHLKGVSQGGLNTTENIQTLCFSHHKMMHSNEKRAGPH